MKIEWWNFGLSTSHIKNKLNDVINKRCISTSLFTEEIERKLEKFLKVKHVIAVSSGSMATVLAFMALKIEPKDEIIIPNVGWISVINACKILGATPVIVDVDKDKPTISIENIKSNITKKTKIIFPIYMNGRTIEINKIKSICKKKKIFLVEDAAQALGIKYKNKFVGTFGDIGIFSMSITKLLSSGQGGFLVTNDKKIAKNLYMMSRHGYRDVRNIKSWDKYGGNFKISDLCSAVAIIQLKAFQTILKKNKENYHYLNNKIKKLNKFIEPANIDLNKGEVPLYNEYKVHNRKKLVSFLEKKNIQTRLSNPNFQRVKYMKIIKDKLGLKNSIIPERDFLYLPGGPSLKKKEIDYLSDCLNKFYLN